MVKRNILLVILTDIFIIAVTLLIFSFTACEKSGSVSVQLSAPVNLQIDDYEMLSWDGVDGASGYRVKVNLNEYQTTDSRLDIFEILDVYGTHKISVMAEGDGEKFIQSDYSEVLEYELSVPEGIGFNAIDGGKSYEVVAKPSLVKGKVIIPLMVEGKFVTKIHNSCFSKCEGLTGIIIPDTVNTIVGDAFKFCSNLKRIKLPSEIEQLPLNLFYKCTSLKSVEIPSGVKKIWSTAFRECPLLESIVFPEALEEIGDRAVDRCPNIKSITVSGENGNYVAEDNCLIRLSDRTVVLGCQTSVIPEFVETIGVHAFNGANTLKEFVIGDNIKNIESSAFSYCTGLTKIVIGDNVRSMAGSVFGECTSLSEITVSAKNTALKSENNCVIRIADNALLAGCKTSVIPDYVESIESGAFSGCRGLTQISIPQDVKKIGVDAFFWCIGLTEIALPPNLTEISVGTFSYCTGLKSVKIPYGVKKIAGYSFDGCTALTNVSIPDSVEEIGERAFYGCVSLKSVIVPESVEIFGYQAFYGCTVYFAGNDFPAFQYYNCSVYKDCDLGYDNHYPYVKNITPSSRQTDILKLYDAVPFREGYLFKGWATEENGEVVYGTDVKDSSIDVEGVGEVKCEYIVFSEWAWLDNFTKDVTLYAVWEKL